MLPGEAGEASAPYIERRVSPPHIGFPMILPVAFFNFLCRRSARVSRVLLDGETLDIGRPLRALATPGHTPDHFCFFLEDEKILFSGDLLRNVSGLERFPRIAWSDAESRSSAAKVMALAPQSVCPGHGLVWRSARDAPLREQ